MQVLVGELVGARLIAHAGSLMTLAKYPASTVQILGAEKVSCSSELFALKGVNGFGPCQGPQRWRVLTNRIVLHSGMCLRWRSFGLRIKPCNP